MLYAKINNNNEIIDYPINLLVEFPDTSFSFPITENQLPTDIVRVFPVERPTGLYETYHEQTPILRNGKYYQNWSAVPLSQEEILAINNTIKTEIINQRNHLLSISDWTELPSVQLLHDETWRNNWAVYRQSLRDLTDQPDFPNNLVWPSVPSA